MQKNNITKVFDVLKKIILNRVFKEELNFLFVKKFHARITSAKHGDKPQQG